MCGAGPVRCRGGGGGKAPAKGKEAVDEVEEEVGLMGGRPAAAAAEDEDDVAEGPFVPAAFRSTAPGDALLAVLEEDEEEEDVVGPKGPKMLSNDDG